jgi:lactate dehydrogenase-like 2-hydroxyacid dehydrogenase
VHDKRPVGDYDMRKILIIDEEFNQHSAEKSLIKSKIKEAQVVELNYSLPEILEHEEDTIGILCQIDFPVGKEFLNEFHNLKAISVYGGGYNNIDVKAATSGGIRVARSPNYCNHEVAEYVIAMILNFAKKLSYLNGRARKGYWGARAVSDAPIDEWSLDEMEDLPQRVDGSSLLVIGYGRIGKLVAKKANALGLSVMFYDPFVKEYNDSTARKTELVEGLSNADFIAITASLNDSSTFLINSSNISHIKRTAFIINAARGKIVEEAALIDALDNRRIRGAALDVFTKEPLPTDHPFFKMNNVFVTPHAIYLSDRSIKELKVLAVNNLLSILAGGKPEGCVNCE